MSKEQGRRTGRKRTIETPARNRETEASRVDVWSDYARGGGGGGRW